MGWYEGGETHDARTSVNRVTEKRRVDDREFSKRCTARALVCKTLKNNIVIMDLTVMYCVILVNVAQST